MTTSDLIDLLSTVEYGASGREREISFDIKNKNGRVRFVPEADISVSSTGDGIAGAELSCK